MAMLCPSCMQRFEQRNTCPRCNVQLVAADGTITPSPGGTPRWSRNAWGRILVGVFVSQGLFLGLYHLLWAGALAAHGDTNSQWTSLYGVLTLQAIQLGALVLGSMLAGAGLRNGALYGSIVGVWNGIFCVMFQNLMGESVTAVDFYGQPVLHTAVGAFGALVGGWIWQPFRPTRYEPSLPQPTVFKPSALFSLKAARPHWGRILLGASVVVAGILFADTILRMVVKASENRISMRTRIEQEIITLEISMLAVFIGAGIAGAGTPNGSMQGAWVAVFSSTFLIGYSIFYRNLGSTMTMLLLIAGVLCLSFLGGSFGSRLLPPIPPRANQRYRPASI